MNACEVPKAGSRKTAFLIVRMIQKIKASILNPSPVRIVVSRAEQSVKAIYLLRTAQQELDLLPVPLLNLSVLHAIKPTPLVHSKTQKPPYSFHFMTVRSNYAGTHESHGFTTEDDMS